MPRPRLLYLSPVIPAFTGNGLAMRAAGVLEALSRQYAVSLQVHPLYLGPFADVPPAVAALCEEVSVGEQSPTSGGGFARWLRRFAGPAPGFDVVHAFRLAMLPFARREAAAGRGLLELDLDDVESISRARIAALCRASGAAALATCEQAQAEQARAMEDAALRACDRVFVCSDADRAVVEARERRAAVCVVPNVVRVPAVHPPRPDGDPFVLLFVGTLGYYPNADAVSFFCHEVLPRLRADTTRPVELRVVGLGATPAVQALGSLPGVRVIGAVPDVTPWYGAAPVVVAPVRAGGGTRIKILEAFAHRRPVVTTTAGLEGIDAIPGRDVLVADTAEDFAAACLRLAQDAALGEALAEQALDLVRRRYSPEAAASAVPAAPVPRGRRGARPGGGRPRPS